MRKSIHRIRALFSLPRLDRELDEEMQLHIEQLVTEFRNEGFDETQARRHALREFGAVERLRDEARDARGLRSFEELVRDLRYGLRMLRKRPAFTIVAVLSLAVGIGANTAIFSAVNAVVLRSLPYDRPDELVDLHLDLPELSFPVLSYPDFEDLRDGTTGVFSGIVASQPTVARIEDDEATVFGESVTGNYFSVLGVNAVLGRTFGPDDDRVPGAHPVIMLDHSYWQRALGGDPGVIGRELRVDGRPYTVVGVVSPDYPGILRGLIRPAFYAPAMMIGELMPNADLLNARDNHNMFSKARLAPGVTLAQAQAAVAAVAATLSETLPKGWDPAGTFSLLSTTDVLFTPDVDGGIKATAWLLMTVVGLVLLVACMNLAGFLLARTLDRRREVAVRLALGASRGTLIRQLLTETMLLSLLGGSIGFGLAVWLLRVAPMLDFGLPVALTPDLAPDFTVLAFTLGVSLLAGTLLGLVPALQSTRLPVAATLKSEGAAGGQPGRQRWRNALVVTQLTVSLVLLVAAGLFLRSLEHRQAVDPGFRTDTAVMPVEVSAVRFDEDEGRQYVRRLAERFRTLPGVEAIGLSHTLPMAPGFQWIDFRVDGHEPPEGREALRANYAIVDTGFFDAMGIPIVQGRRFEESDRPDGEPVVILSAAMARRFWPDGDAVGRLVRLVGGSPALPGPNADLRVVGVAGDIDWESLNEAPQDLTYVPYAQYYTPFVTFVARTSADAALAARSLLAAGREIDPELSVREAETMEQHLSALLRPAQVVASLLALFAMLVLALATIGLYGVVSYAVATRSREVGIRMALGANASAIRRLLTVGGLRLVLLGGGIGLGISILVNRLLSSTLFGIGAFDAPAFLGAFLTLGVTALVASYLPARRASRVNPVAALRNE